MYTVCILTSCITFVILKFGQQGYWLILVFDHVACMEFSVLLICGNLFASFVFVRDKLVEHCVLVS